MRSGGKEWVGGTGRVLLKESGHSVVPIPYV